jgi:para-nitrobenzyl esterase
VLVWVHGGGLANGAGSDYDARRLAVGGQVVVVTINYRLGALGFLGLGALLGSGTLGLQDQQAALGWVRRNVANFGGDPARVTLAGESGGAQGICAQLTSPGATGGSTRPGRAATFRRSSGR